MWKPWNQWNPYSSFDPVSFYQKDVIGMFQIPSSMLQAQTEGKKGKTTNFRKMKVEETV
jgi:hypothetical protein